MRIVRISPYPHAEIRISVSEQMEADLKKCYEKSRAGEPGNCGGMQLVCNRYRDE